MGSALQPMENSGLLFPPKTYASHVPPRCFTADGRKTKTLRLINATHTTTPRCEGTRRLGVLNLRGSTCRMLPQQHKCTEAAIYINALPLKCLGSLNRFCIELHYNPFYEMMILNEIIMSVKMCLATSKYIYSILLTSRGTF